jgi:hypothetical protein
MPRFRPAAAWAALLVVAPLVRPLPAQEAPATKGADPIERIKEEGLKRSEVMKTLDYLTNAIGPRLTNSPGMKRANEWTRDRMAKWGMENAHLEAWGPFGRGWSLVKFSAQVTEPQCIPLIAFPKAWSPGLEGGHLTGPLVLFDPKDEKELESFKGKLDGKIVIVGTPRDPKAWFEPPGHRYTDSELLELANAPNPLDGTGGGFRRGGAPTGGQPGQRPSPEDIARLRLERRKVEFVYGEKPAMILSASSRGDGGTLFVQSASTGATGFTRSGPRVWDKGAKVIPQVVLAPEHFNRLVRMIRAGEALTIAVDLEVKFHDDDLMGYNTIAEIPGSDKKDEIVMMGGHLDAWHAGTGATDNAAGCAVAMEAARIIQALELKPRRTIRVALWSGEEQGLLGSRAYAQKHFGEVKTDGLSGAVASFVGGLPKRSFVAGPEHDKLSAYFNMDNGTGKLRGLYMEGNEAVRPLFRKWLAPLRDLGATTLTLSRTGGTDHMSFDGVGLPGFQFIQDPVEYETRTHHSNMDTYERLQEEDLKQAAVVLATFVYNTAMLDDKLPRKPMPGTTTARERVAER